MSRSSPRLETTAASCCKDRRRAVRFFASVPDGANPRAWSVDLAISARSADFAGAGLPMRRKTPRQTDSTSSFAPPMASLGFSFARRLSRLPLSSMSAKSSTRVIAKELGVVPAGRKAPSAKRKPSRSAAFTRKSCFETATSSINAPSASPSRSSCCGSF